MMKGKVVWKVLIKQKVETKNIQHGKGYPMILKNNMKGARYDLF